MDAELDHVFVLCAPGAPEAAALVALGLVEGPPNTHPGQGTACRRFFFAAAYLELLWVDSLDEARREPAVYTGLWQRWAQREQGGSPFGVVLRGRAGSHRPSPPFPSWSYRPAYLPAGRSIEVATGVPASEPAYFWFDAAHASAVIASEKRWPRTISSVRFGLPGDEPLSGASLAARSCGVLTFFTAPSHVLELTFDHGRSSRRADLSGTLPLRLRW